MKKKVFSALLLAAFAFATTSTVVSCKDYDDDINNLQAQIDANKSAIAALQKLISDGKLVQSVVEISSPQPGITVTMTDGTATNIYGIKGEKGDTGATGATGAQGEKGEKGDKGDKGDTGATGATGAAGKDATVWTIGDDGYWYKDGEKTEYKAVCDCQGGQDGQSGQDGTDGKDGKDGQDGKDGKDGDTIYYVPNGNGFFDIYKNGEYQSTTTISYIGENTTSGVTAVWDSERKELKLSGVEDAEGGVVTISLNGTLKSLVFVPFIYLDGIETIEYPWIGDTILRNEVPTQDYTDLSHHGIVGGPKSKADMHDIAFNKAHAFDYIHNGLRRYYDYTTKEIKIGDQPANKKRVVTAEDEWIYGPAWAVQYHLNPSTAVVDYEKMSPKYNVLESDVIYYNTRASESSLGVSSPEKFFAAQYPVYTAAKYGYWGKLIPTEFKAQGLWNQKAGSFNSAKAGILTAGIQIAHPDKLAPWPTDETINPNGNTDSNISYPASSTADGQTNAPAGDFDSGKNKTVEAYAGNSWYGFAKYKYDKNNTDNAVALQLKNNEDATITSDYALLMPTRVQLEGLIWYEKPMYKEPALAGYPELGPNRPDNKLPDRIGDEEGWAKNEKFDCSELRIHVWDSPEEALNDPAGAALELPALDPAGLDLKPYLGVHFIKENYKKKEVGTGIYNDYVYDTGTWAYGEEAAFGLHYEFQLVDYCITTNKTYDSRYATFKTYDHTADMGVAENQKCDVDNYYVDRLEGENNHGIVIAKTVKFDKAGEGHIQDEQNVASVDREPLVRVMLKNAKGDVLLDGYILLHIYHEQANATAAFPAQDKEFNLCDPLSMQTTWAQFDKIILQDLFKAETGKAWEIEGFNRTYWADCKVGKDPVPAEEERFVTPYAFKVQGPVDSQQRGYQMKQFNFGDLYGNKNGAIATPPEQGGADEEGAIEFQDKQLGNIVYYLNSASTDNHIFRWTLSEEEVEYLTHHAKSYPVTVTRWVRFVAKDEVNDRESNTYSDAPVRYIWVQLTMKISRDQSIVYYEEKDENQWYNWNPGGTQTLSTVEQGWSSVVLDIYAPGSTKETIKNKNWDSEINEKLTEDYIRLPESFNSINPWGGRTNPIQVGKYDKRMKYYFAPKTYTIKGQSGTVYTITPQGPQQPNWNKIYCKYIYKHTYDNMVEAYDHWVRPAKTGTMVDYFYNKKTITKDDVHTWQAAWNASTLKFDWSGSDTDYASEAGLKTLMTTCATDYNKGMFNNTILYAKNGTVYTPIAYITLAEQDGENLAATQKAGEIRLVHWLSGNAISDTKANENVVLYDILNALGYPLKDDGTCDYEYAQKHINQQLRGWVGLVANNGCDVAKFVQQGLYDDENSATFLASWQRPINLKYPGIKHALDAKTTENVLYLLDNLQLYDWRGDYDGNGNLNYKNGYMYRVGTDMADNHFWFWAYYNVKGIALDMRRDKILTNLHQTDKQKFEPLSKTDPAAHIWAGKPYMQNGQIFFWGEGWLADGTPRTGQGLPNSWFIDASSWKLVENQFYAPVGATSQQCADVERKIEEYMGIYPVDYDKRARFGSIYYENSDENLTEFDIIVPVEIFYEWGSLKYNVRWHIDSTHGRSSSGS